MSKHNTYGLAAQLGENRILMNQAINVFQPSKKIHNMMNSYLIQHFQVLDAQI